MFCSLSAAAAVQFTESTPYAPRRLCSAAKTASDHLVRAWHETCGLAVMLSNCCNNYGPYQCSEELVPVAFPNAPAEKALPISSGSTNVRDCLYVEDHADAPLLVATKGVLDTRYSIGGEKERTNLGLVETTCGILDRLCSCEAGTHADPITFVTDWRGHELR